MRKLIGRKRLVVIGGAAAFVAIGSTSAFAYFTSTGSGTGSASVGSATDFSVTQTGPGSGTIYPGSATGDVLTFTVTNAGKGDQQYGKDATAVVADSNGFIEQNGVSVQGCKAKWFNAVVTTDPSINTNIAAGGTATATVTVTMPTDSADNQDKCQGVSPDVTFTVSK